ncbi:MerR family transcriptional regulator [Acrocarpospora phusangensis]|uniref:MerR family transcriptional regulator n=1 Tax=Acrocarpospora phusangensis TaxID=1070424 RepID=UPI001950891A|nr:MerR family transcriptional regulator [Acrocarpospora phusangensis]
MTEADNGRRWSVGELARATGLTVRALHHYDQIGLLTPQQRTLSGHRRYTEHDLRRLYRIRALSALGLSLDEIGSLLASQDDELTALQTLLTAQLDGLNTQAARINELRIRIDGLLQRIATRQMPDPDQFMSTLELITVYETYFTQEQRDQLAERRAALGPEAIEAAKHEWASLVEALLPHAEANTPVDTPEVADLIVRYRALGARFHPPAEQGEQTTAAANRMWQENSQELASRLPWPPDRMIALINYIAQAH